MAIKLQIRRDISTNWTAENPELLPGEICFETDTGKIKIGKTAGNVWNTIPYIIASASSHVHNITDITNFSDNVESVIMGFLVSSTDISVTYNASIDKLELNILKSSSVAGGLLGSLVYQSAVDTTTVLAGNTSTTKQFLAQTGNGTISASPVWSALTKTDVGLGNVENTALTTALSDFKTTNQSITGLWQFNQLGYTRTDLGNMTGTVNLNLNNSSYFMGTVTGAVTFTIALTSSGSILHNFGLKIINGGAFSIVWPAIIKWTNATTPSLSSSGTDVLTFISDNNGTTWLNIGQILDIK